MPQTRSIHDFPHVLESIDIDVSTLGCVMLPVEPFDVFADGRDDLLDRENLYTSPDPAKFWVKGDVASQGGHATLLYGLLKPAYEIEREVRAVLQGWRPDPVLHAESVGVFPSPYPDEPYGCIVAKLHVTEALRDAHARLSYLPHVDTFPDYTPHVTLAYAKKEVAQDWADLLNLDTLVFATGADIDLGRNHS